ncbi:hypothetical protein Mapa_016361 [Marchantia paleacea]|nr:hypothetical protein Mapa_016361 [Marchantia paleacea]
MCCDAIFYLDMKLFDPSAHSCSSSSSSSSLATNHYYSYSTCSFLSSSICLPSFPPSIFLPRFHLSVLLSISHSPTQLYYSFTDQAAAALIMARLPVQQLSTQLTISIMMLLSYSSIFLPLSDAGIADTFTKGVDLALTGNVAPTPRLRWMVAGASAESFNDKIPVAHRRDVSSSSAVSSDCKAAVTRTVLKLNGDLEAEETRSRLERDIVGISHAASNAGLDWSLGESPLGAKSFHEFRSAAPAADESLQQQLRKVALLRFANVPALGMWQITDDDEDNLRTEAVVWAAVSGVGSDPAAAKSRAEVAFSRLQHDNYTKRKALQADISPPGLWQDSDDQSQVKVGKRSLLADISPPGIWTDAEVIDSRFQKRSLLADISPPGLWSDDGDDTQDKYHKRRLLADISPPGMWQGSDYQISDVARYI